MSAVRPREIFTAELHAQRLHTDRVMAAVLVLQLAVAIGLALAISPAHVLLAVAGGVVINAVPLLLIRKRPGWVGTRHVVAVSQMLWSALLIHISGGRLETHFHVFASLAVLSMYRDPWLFATATVVVVVDHFARGVLVPVFVDGVAPAEWWRFLELAAWVTLEDAALVYTTHKSLGEMRMLASRAVDAEEENARIERLVTDRTRELSDSREQYRALVETAQAMPWEVDAESLALLYVGPQSRRLLGIDAEVGVANPELFRACIHPEDAEAAVESLQTAMSGTGFEIELRMRNAADGRVLYTQSTGMLVVDRGRSVLRGLTFDVTARKKLELELAQSQKLESVGRLASGIAHEINTPVQFISDNVHFLRESFAHLAEVIDVHGSALAHADVPAPTRAKIAAVEADAELDFLRENVPSAISACVNGLERIASIVRSMKQLAHQDGAEPSFVDLNQLVLSTVTVARSEYKYVAELVTELGTLPPVLCVGSDLTRTVLALVVNAAQAIAAKGKERGLISVRTWREGARVCLSVADTGVGVGADIREHIFDPFFTTKPVGQGAGQGLSVARSVVERHGGTLSLVSEPGNGAAFTVTLPIDTPDRKAA